jgi:hypothetical protein
MAIHVDQKYVYKLETDRLKETELRPICLGAKGQTSTR